MVHNFSTVRLQLLKLSECFVFRRDQNSFENAGYRKNRMKKNCKNTWNYLKMLVVILDKIVVYIDEIDFAEV